VRPAARVAGTGVRLGRPFRDAVASVRSTLARAPRERRLFDVLCAAGELGYRLPDDDINLRHVAGARDPRRRLAREFAGVARRASAKEWTSARTSLARDLARALRARGDDDLRPLSVLLGYAPTALGCDGGVPSDALQRHAWLAVVDAFARLDTTRVRRLGGLPRLGPARLERLRRDAARTLRKGRTASGRRPGPEGRSLAVDRALMRHVGRALGRRLAPGYQARYLYYVAPGDHIWPHPDDPKYAANLLVCLDRRVPDGGRGSAFLAYRPDGSVERHELVPGESLVMESNLVHAREPVRPGERVVLLSIQYAPARRAAAARKGSAT
jgi:hypothetical protein